MGLGMPINWQYCTFLISPSCTRGYWFKGINTGIKHSLTNFSNLLPFSIPSAKNTSCTPSEDTIGMAEYRTPLINILWSTGGMPLRLYPNFLALYRLSHPLSSVHTNIAGSYLENSAMNLARKSSDLCIVTWRITCLLHPMNLSVLQMVSTLTVMPNICSNFSCNSCRVL